LITAEDGIDYAGPRQRPIHTDRTYGSCVPVLTRPKTRGRDYDTIRYDRRD